MEISDSLASNAEIASNGLIIRSEIFGTGRANVILVEQDSSYEAYIEELAPKLEIMGQVHLLRTGRIGDRWQEGLDCLLEYLENNKIRNASFVGVGDASVLVQALCFKRPRMIRTLIFIDPSTRAHPSKLVKLIDKVEEFLPLGLPFRSDFPGFDGKAFLQRIRCPVLIALSPFANNYLREQAKLMNSGMPTSFLVEASSNDFNTEFIKLVSDFMEIPAKFPQKNLRTK